jgi:hypothetical protein
MRHQQAQTRAIADEALLRGGAANGEGETVNSVSMRNGALGPAASIEFDAPPITAEKSGQMLVTFSLSGTDATPSDTLSVQLGRGAVALLTEVAPVGADAGGTWQFSVSVLDSPGAGATTYKCTVTSVGGHNITSAANRGFVSVIEQQ